MLKLYWKRFKENLWAVTGSIIVVLLIAVAVGATKIAPHDPLQQNLLERLQPPSTDHWCGTDDFGRDVFSRIIVGTRVSLLIGFLAALISIFIGTLIGLCSGYWSGWVDAVLMRISDVVLCFPTMFLILMIVGVVQTRSIYLVILVIALTSWAGLGRMVRAEVLSVRERDFILAAKGLGVSTPRIMLVHLLPNVLTPVLVAATLTVGGAIMGESVLSFLGFGVQPPNPSWGNILTAGKDFIHIAWWLSLFPGLAIFVTVLAFNLLGEGLRDVLDPRL